MERGPIRAAIISDTHGVLRPEVERILETCDVIVHAGDFDTQMLYHKLEVNQPLFAVRETMTAAGPEAFRGLSVLRSKA